MTTQTKLSSHTIWLFAFGSIAAGIVSSYALSGLGQKVTAAVYFAIVAAGGFASTYLTSARVRGAVLAFVLGAAVAGAAMGKTFGIFIAAIVFLETIVAGIGGAVAGGKARGQGGLAALGSLARSTR